VCPAVTGSRGVRGHALQQSKVLRGLIQGFLRLAWGPPGAAALDGRSPAPDWPPSQQKNGDCAGLLPSC